jgi:hypothetical protein
VVQHVGGERDAVQFLEVVRRQAVQAMAVGLGFGTTRTQLREGIIGLHGHAP